MTRILTTLILGTGLLALPVLAQETTETPPPPCSTPEFRQFDFWVGTWDAKWDGGGGTNVVTAVLGDCVIEENFDGRNAEGKGLVGISHSVYSPVKKKWLQTWVDNNGSYLDFEGEFAGGKMILSREAEGDGVKFLQRMVWHNITDEAFDWNWERSDDGGKTWKEAWVIRYERRR